MLTPSDGSRPGRAPALPHADLPHADLPYADLPRPPIPDPGLRALLVLLFSLGLGLPAGLGEATDRRLLAQEPLRDRGGTRLATGDPGRDTTARAPRAVDAGPPSWARDLALFVGLLGFDRSLEGAVADVRARRDPTLEDAASTAKSVGNWQSSLPVFAAGVGLVGGLTEGGDGLKKTAAVLGGVLAGSMANEALNQLVGRSRPSEDAGAFAFDPLDGHASFPSGHAAFAFSMAGGVDAATDGWLPAAAAYTVAGACAASRVYHGKHWVSDIAVGAAIGTAVSRWSTRRGMELLGVGGEEVEEAGEGAGRAGAGAGLPGRIRPVATPTFIGLNIRF